MNIQAANALFANGTFSALYKAGFITDKVFLYREVYLWVTAQEQTRRISRNQAVTEAQGKFDRDKRTIWRAMQSFSGTDIVVSPHL
ncbi:hypothetical protein [Mucilaginibacter sp.]